MVGTKNNRRTQYTIDTIQRALIELLNNAPIEKITVTQICELADVNRGTFYRYFLDPYDCLEKIETKFMAVVEEKMLALPDIPEVGVVPFVKSHLLLALEQIAANADLMKMVFLSGHSKMLQNLFNIEAATEPGPVTVEEVKTEKQRNQYYNQEYYGTAVLSVIKAWLRLDMPETPAELTDKIVARIMNSPELPALPPKLTHSPHYFEK
ncbi:TetR/AcrR family transcriptional regulator [Lentilactobacillus senioris]|uniref:TetR/AcrR family transcriptional regulator n=1 Tax=Lentilactobacillus senioris TaxID=931534 RepID=UPI00227FDA8F|nr:TetR/AcrR family transcriptional regulator [Lentilactobacillus senioris]MCY9806151.1 TetR/AcrR family transcriptional regulator [Lentilactobacillus senioris]